MKKSFLDLLFASLIAFSAGGCSSSFIPDETSAEWQKDVAVLTLNDNSTFNTVQAYTTLENDEYRSDYPSIWCKEWGASSSSHPQLTIRYQEKWNDDWVEKRYAECWWAITKILDLGDVPGSDWSNSFEAIHIVDSKDYYGGKYLSSHSRQHKNVTAVWYKEWERGNSGVRCLSVRYKFQDDDYPEMMRETRYVGCRYVIEKAEETSSASAPI